MRNLTRNEFLKVNKEIDFENLEIGMELTVDDTDEPGWYEVVSVRNWRSMSEDFVVLKLIDLNEEDDDYNEDDIWDLILDYNIATHEELKLITGINGYSIETLNDVIYYKTGYHDIKQYLESEGE